MGSGVGVAVFSGVGVGVSDASEDSSEVSPAVVVVSDLVVGDEKPVPLE